MTTPAPDLAGQLMQMLVDQGLVQKPAQDQKPQPVRRVLTSAEQGLVRALRSARAQKAAATKLEDDIKAQLAEIFAAGETLGVDDDGNEVVKRSDRERKGVDSKLLAQAYPEAFEATKTTTPYTVWS